METELSSNEELNARARYFYSSLFFGVQNRPSECTIRRIVEKFEETCSVCDITRCGYQRSACSAKNIVAVRDSVEENPNLSIPRRSQQLQLSYGTTWRILHRDLNLHAYKIQLTQELKPQDHSMCRNFANWALEKLQVDDSFGRKIILSDEAHFFLNGFVNKQNCRIWGTENLRTIQQQVMYPQKVTVWCGFCAGGVIGPYFFEATVNGQRYRHVITTFFRVKLNNMNVDDMWFQQDGATCHTSKETVALLTEMFNGHIISRGGDINWPPRSCDLTPLDFFLWGFLKSKVYANNPKTIDELKNNITAAINEVEFQLCENVMENWVKRIGLLKKSRGEHLNDIVFRN
ncbi:Transposable element Tc3 transposase [Anthophora quadrimaculata]